MYSSWLESKMYHIFQHSLSYHCHSLYKPDFNYPLLRSHFEDIPINHPRSIIDFVAYIFSVLELFRSDNYEMIAYSIQTIAYFIFQRHSDIHWSISNRYALYYLGLLYSITLHIVCLNIMFAVIYKNILTINHIA